MKASKIIPVMVMGKIVSKKKFEYYEYVTAVMMSLGMIMFLLNNGGDQKGNVSKIRVLPKASAYFLIDHD